jgi:hypothetical protein
MPDTVTERTVLILKLCEVCGCRDDECENHRLPECDSMQSVTNIPIFRRKMLLHVRNTGSVCGGSRTFRNVDTVLKNFSPTTVITRLTEP